MATFANPVWGYAIPEEQYLPPFPSQCHRVNAATTVPYAPPHPSPFRRSYMRKRAGPYLKYPLPPLPPPPRFADSVRGDAVPKKWRRQRAADGHPPAARDHPRDQGKAASKKRGAAPDASAVTRFKHT